MVGNLVLRRRTSGAVKLISDRIYKNIPPQTGYPNSKGFYNLVVNLSVASRKKAHKQNVIQQNVTILMTSNYFRQRIAGYTVTNF